MEVLGGAAPPESPLRENQLGVFGENALIPPTPPSNIRNLIAQKEKVRGPDGWACRLFACASLVIRRPFMIVSPRPEGREMWELEARWVSPRVSTPLVHFVSSSKVSSLRGLT